LQCQTGSFRRGGRELLPRSFGHAVRRADLILPDRSTALLSPHRSELGHSLTRTLMQAFGSLGARVSQYNSHRPTKRQPVQPNSL
jgi:hypothetical protein